jgi:hypothetical protein
MLDHNSLFWALAYAEMKFIIYASFLFCICFYFGVGFEVGPLRFASFFAFFTFNLAIYSYFGQAFTCCFRGMGTAQILAAVFIGLNNLFSGLIVRPQYLSGKISSVVVYPLSSRILHILQLITIQLSSCPFQNKQDFGRRPFG